LLDFLTLAAGMPGIPRSLFALPLILVVSLVYSASRHESPARIVVRAARLALTIAGFMTIVLVGLLILSRGM